MDVCSCCFGTPSDNRLRAPIHSMHACQFFILIACLHHDVTMMSPSSLMSPTPLLAVWWITNSSRVTRSRLSFLVPLFNKACELPYQREVKVPNSFQRKSNNFRVACISPSACAQRPTLRLTRASKTFRHCLYPEFTIPCSFNVQSNNFRDAGITLCLRSTHRFTRAHSLLLFRHVN
jgi:hypothetical protein